MEPLKFFYFLKTFTKNKKNAMLLCPEALLFFYKKNSFVKIKNKKPTKIHSCNLSTYPRRMDGNHTLFSQSGTLKTLGPSWQ